MPQQPSNQFVQGFNNFIQAVNTDIAAAASTIANSLADAAYTQSQAMEAIFDSYAQQFQQFSNAAQNYADIAATRADASAQAAWQATADQFNNWADSRASQAGDAWLDSVRSQMLGDLGKAAGPIGDTIDLGQLAGNVANNNWNGVGQKSAGILGGIALGALLSGLAAGFAGLVGLPALPFIAGGLIIGGIIGGDLGEFIWGLFNDSKNWSPPRRDPLAIDMDGDGIETIGADGTVVFDHDGDGVKTGTGWVSPDDGLLVLDRNNNGLIDTGAELFGVDTVKTDGSLAVDGFDALSDLDSNSDGVFDAQDAEFANVQIWQDLDQDGISDTGELTSLTDAGIVRIDLNTEANNVNLGNGNVQTATSAHLTVDGEEGTTGNLDLAHNPFYSEFTNSIELTEAAQGLPDSRGSGMVRNLRESMSLSGDLTTIVSNYASQDSYQDQHAQLDALVEAWADTSTMQTSIELAEEQNFNLIYMVPGQSFSDFSETGSVSGGSGGGSGGSISLPDQEAIEQQAALMAQQQEVVRMIAILEMFNGDQFVTVEPDSVTTGAGQTITVSSETSSNGGSVSNPGAPRRAFVMLSQQQIDLLTQSYEQLKDSVYSNLVTQTRLVDYTDELQLAISESGEISLDFTEVNALLTTRQTENPANALADLIELNRYHGTPFYSSGWNGIELLQTWVNDASGDAALEAVLTDLNVYNGNETTSGTNDSEIFFDDDNGSNITAQGGNDILIGGAGNDHLYGESGNDVLEGGDGRDYLYGGNGDDTLRGGAGANDYLSGDAGNDTYLFGAGDGNTTVYNYDTGASRNDVLRFLEGIDASDVVASRRSSNLVLTVGATGEVITVQSYFRGDGAGGYALNAIEFADGTVWDVDAVKAMVLEGTAGNDTMTGFASDDMMNGGAGNDNISGADGADTLSGGDGNDYLYGGNGDDTLRGGAGANDYLSGDARNDTYVFDADFGTDTVSNYDPDANSVDIAQFDNVSIEDLWFSRSGNDLRITVAGTDNQVTVSSWYGDSNYQLDRIETGSSVLLNNQVDQLVNAMAAYDVPLGAGNVVPQDVQDELQTTLAETWQS